MVGPLNIAADDALAHPGQRGPCSVHSLLAELDDPCRQRRLPLRLYMAEGASCRGLVLFSHGLGGSRDGGRDWLEHWASHGLAGLAVQHPGSDSSLLGDSPSPLALRRAFKDAMAPEQLAHRLADLRHVIAAIGKDPALPLPTPLSTAPIGLCGHSFGAVTVQLLAGENRPEHPPCPLDPRVRAALALSPSARQPEREPGLNTRFGSIGLPFMSITGSRDDGMGLSDITAANRELPFRHMRPGHKHLLVFDGGNHLDFAGQASTMEGSVFRVRRDPPPFHGALLTASTAFWLAHLTDSEPHQDWLRSGLSTLLRPKDRHETR